MSEVAVVVAVVAAPVAAKLAADGGRVPAELGGDPPHARPSRRWVAMR
ncbi:hypothetical protein RM445_31430 [Pseudonocardia sp. DSM 45834]|uniref:Uncharacterized protein n=1 Tax=Pseudonocardia charpentierae TaxID=3075545 RepID=A0ABU2NK82_9PSEU|nr:hypothetical protein [Pseudonocardia sp. DSM 45834]MDT0353997.1 hypothetical protein [Pseudonocardia sp. DSM 45834]